MGATENKATVSAMYAAFGQGDVAGVVGANAPDALWTIHSGAGSPYGGEHKGLDALGAFFQTIGDSIEITQFDMAPIAADGDIVVAAGEQTYKVKATGKTVQGPVLHLFNFGPDGKVVRFEEWESNTDGAFS